MTQNPILINRAPVLTLWAAVVAERLGFDREAALSLGKTLAGLNAQAKGRRLGIYKPAERVESKPPRKAPLGEEFWVELLGRMIPAKNTGVGIRAVDKEKPVEPGPVLRYLSDKFGEALEQAENAMRELASAYEPAELNDKAFALYEHFRPVIPEGIRGWGAKGELRLDSIRALGKPRK